MSFSVFPFGNKVVLFKMHTHLCYHEGSYRRGWE